jgi:uncharacterized protein YcbK (DUF882 family)
VYYDWEYQSHDYIKKTYGITATKQLVSDVTNAFCKYCENQGWWSGFYANIDYLTNFYTDTIKSRFALWVANYASKCSYTGDYGIWQYTESGTVSGVSGKVDMDYCYVDYPSKIKNAKLNGYGTSTTTNTTTTTTSSITYPTWSGVKTFSYSKDGATYVSPHFQVKEFASISGSKLYSDNVLISYDLVQMLEKLFTKLKCKSITVNSGYRTSTHDKAVGGSGSGQHVLGKASDIVCKNSNGVISAKIVCCVASDLGFGGVANISSKYQAVHVDVRTGSQYRGDEIRGNSSIWKYNSKWTDFYTYFGLSKADVEKYTA